MTTNIEFETQVASNPSNLKINHFSKVMAEGSLVLRPPFQRNLVWNKEQQSFLVDSVLRGLPVPEIYIVNKTAADGSEETIVIDGQQRITTCLHFIADELRLTDSTELDPRWKNKKFSELSPDLQKRFRSFQLIVRELPDLEDSALREVFRRLNKTVEPLEPQELRHAAYTGPLITFIEQLAGMNVFTEVGAFSPRDFLRRRNDEFLSEVVFAVHSGAYPNKKDGLDDLFKVMDLQGVPEGVISSLTRKFSRVIEQLELIASRLRKTRFRNKSDFYTLLVSMAKSAEMLPLDESKTSELVESLSRFSALVNEIKRSESAGSSVDDLTGTAEGKEALLYLRNVERAASDRMSRVRREKALQTVLDPIFSGATAKTLNSRDERWLDSEFLSDLDDEEAYEAPSAEEKAETQRVLLTDETAGLNEQTQTI